MTITTDLHARHRALWALGDYGAIADEVVAPLGSKLVAAAGIRAGQRVLDVAAGTGNGALAAARLGAEVVASDLCPELIEQGRAAAAAGGLTLAFEEANAEALPYPSATFDVVMSCIGVMFAPGHSQAAAELVRVCAPGGTVALLNWTPDGFVGRLFATMKPYLPASPPGSRPAPRWGDPAYVAELLGDVVGDLQFRRGTLPVDRFADGAAFRDYFKARYGPTIAAYRGLGDDAAAVAALDADLAALGDDALSGSAVMRWEYLVATARRR